MDWRSALPDLQFGQMIVWDRLCFVRAPRKGIMAGNGLLKNQHIAESNTNLFSRCAAGLATILPRQRDGATVHASHGNGNANKGFKGEGCKESCTLLRQNHFSLLRKP